MERSRLHLLRARVKKMEELAKIIMLVIFGEFGLAAAILGLIAWARRRRAKNNRIIYIYQTHYEVRHK